MRNHNRKKRQLANDEESLWTYYRDEPTLYWGTYLEMFEVAPPKCQKKKKKQFLVISYHFLVWVLKISISRLISDLNISLKCSKNPSLKSLKEKKNLFLSQYLVQLSYTKQGERSKSIRKVVCLFVFSPKKKHRNSTQSNFHLSLLHRCPNKWIFATVFTPTLGATTIKTHLCP